MKKKVGFQLPRGAVHKVCHAPIGGGGLRKCDSL